MFSPFHAACLSLVVLAVMPVSRGRDGLLVAGVDGDSVCM